MLTGMKLLIGVVGLVFSLVGVCLAKPPAGLLQVRSIGGERAESSDGLEVFCRTAKKILESEIVAKRARARLKTLSPDLEAALNEAVGRGRLKVHAEWLEGTSLIRVEGVGGDEELSGRYSEAVMTEYVKFLAEQSSAVADHRLDALTGQIMRLEKHVEVAEEEMLKVQAAAGTADGQRDYEKAKKRYSTSVALYDELADRLRRIDIEKNLRGSADVVEIIQRPVEGN